MLTSHELFGFMSPALALEILESAFANDKEIYRATVAAVAQARRVRPIFLERQPRKERHHDILSSLSRPALEQAAAMLLRGWLLKQHKSLLVDFLDALGLTHKDGVVEDLPATMEDAKLKPAIETVLARHPPQVVALYLHAFSGMNDTKWDYLDNFLRTDPRVQF
jgi:hypothetical protein